MPWFAHLDGRYGRSGRLERKTCIQQTLQLDDSICTTGQLVTPVKSSVRAYSLTSQARPAVNHVVSTGLVSGYLLDGLLMEFSVRMQ